MPPQYTGTPDREDSSLRSAFRSASSSWTSSVSRHAEVLHSSTVNVSSWHRGRYKTTRSFPGGNLHQGISSENTGGRLSAILRSSHINSPTVSRCLEPRGHPIIEGDSSSWQHESPYSGCTIPFIQEGSGFAMSGAAPMSPVFLVSDHGAGNKNNQEQLTERRCQHEDNRHTDVLGLPTFDSDHLTGSNQASSNGQMDTIKPLPSVSPRTKSGLAEERGSLTCSQQQHHPALTVINTTRTLQIGDSSSGGEGLPPLEYATAAILVSTGGRTANKMGANPTGCGNQTSPSGMDNQWCNNDPVLLNYSSLWHCVENVQQFCFTECCAPFSTSTVLPAVDCETMTVPNIFRAMQLRHDVQEQTIQETVCQYKKDHSQDEKSYEVYSRGRFLEQEEKVGCHDRSRSELEKSVLCSKDNLALYLNRTNDHMPRPFHPAIGRPQTIIANSSRSIATCLDTPPQIVSKGAKKRDPEIGLTDNKTVNISMVPEQLSSPHTTHQCDSPSPPLTWRPSCPQSTMQGQKAKEPSKLMESLSHLTDNETSMRASKKDDWQCCDALSQHSQTPCAFRASPVSDKKDSDSPIYCGMPRNMESFQNHIVARTPCRQGAKSVPSSRHCNETVTLERKYQAVDSNSNDIKPYKVNQTEAVTPTVKPLNAYNYFYSEMREGILQLSKAEIEMLILKDKKHDEMKYSHSCPDRSCTLYQPGLLAHAILQKQNARFCNSERKRLLLSKHWNKDRTTRRKHRAKHGILSFNQMNTLVSTEWNLLPETQKMFYKDVAAADSKRYKEQKEQ